MKKLIKPLKSKAMLRIATFATLFVLMDTFIEMNKKTEEQTTYSITLEDLASANIEADGECTSTTTNCIMTQNCSGGMCSILNAKKRFLANGCIKCCDYTCTVQSIPL